MSKHVWRILLIVYLAFLTGWVYLLHQQGVAHHDALGFLFKYLATITGTHT